MSRALQTVSALVRCRRGVAAVEAAFVLPIVLLFCLGIVEFGRLYWIRNSLQFSVAETGRYAIAHEDTTASALTTLASKNFGDVSNGALNVSVCGDSQGGDNYVTIKATYNFSFLTGLIPIKPLTLEGKSRVPLFSRDTQLTPACS